MADKKISALTSATTPLAGTEVLPIVQSGATVKVAVSDLTAGRAISATAVTASTGNFVVGTSGQGIDFSATPGTGTSELFKDYEEGTWTPVLTANTPGNLSVTYGSQVGYYTKVGRLVSLQCIISTSAFTHTTASSFVKITGLPFTSANFAGLENSSGISAFGGITKVGYTTFGFYVAANSDYLIGQASGSALAYDFLYITDLPTGTNKILEFTLTYNAAS